VLPTDAEAVTNAIVIIVVIGKNVGSVDNGLTVLSKIRDRFNPTGAKLTKLMATYW